MYISAHKSITISGKICPKNASESLVKNLGENPVTLSIGVIEEKHARDVFTSRIAFHPFGVSVGEGCAGVGCHLPYDLDVASQTASALNVHQLFLCLIPRRTETGNLATEHHVGRHEDDGCFKKQTSNDLRQISSEEILASFASARIVEAKADDDQVRAVIQHVALNPCESLRCGLPGHAGVYHAERAVQVSRRQLATENFVINLVAERV